MKNLNRKTLRKILMEEVLNASEMAQFSGSKSGRAVKKVTDTGRSAHCNRNKRS